MFYFILFKTIFKSPGWLLMLCEAKADFELLILLCLPPKFWDYRYAPPCLLPVVLGMELTASCVIGNATLQTELQPRFEHGYPQTLSTVFKYFSCWAGKIKPKGWWRENRKQTASTAERWGKLALKEAILQSRTEKRRLPLLCQELNCLTVWS